MKSPIDEMQSRNRGSTKRAPLVSSKQPRKLYVEVQKNCLDKESTMVK